jgi:hypothetical protein
MLEHKPHHVRRKIAFLCTAGIALVLVLVMVLHYTKPKVHGESETGERFKDFYNTVADPSQSPFETK